MSEVQTQLGQLITGDVERDAIHIAVAPVTATELLKPGQTIGFADDATNELVCSRLGNRGIGIVDPFLHDSVEKGQRFWMFLKPNTITSLKHVWTHPSFAAQDKNKLQNKKADSETWMREWAVQHMREDYYSDDGGWLSDDDAYANSIRAGFNHQVGPYEDARDYIDNEWWQHWENITGQTGERDTYFSCAC